jgi:hypothetical protein
MLGVLLQNVVDALGDQRLLAQVEHSGKLRELPPR